MKKTRPTTKRSTVAGVAFAAAMAAAIGAAPAGAITIDVDSECVSGCVTDLRECLDDSREAFLECATEGGCVALQAAMRLACRPDRTASVCVEARAEYNDCIQPCRAELRSDTKACQNAALACLNDECGLVDLPDQCGRASVTVD